MWWIAHCRIKVPGPGSAIIVVLGSGVVHRIRKPPMRIVFVCRAWIDPPSARHCSLAPVFTYGKGSNFGLIHNVEFTDQYVSMRIPDPQAWLRLVWVNLWADSYLCQNHPGGRLHNSVFWFHLPFCILIRAVSYRSVIRPSRWDYLKERACENVRMCECAKVRIWA